MSSVRGTGLQRRRMPGSVCWIRSKFHSKKFAKEPSLIRLVDCVWDAWGEWGDCSVTCEGEGERQRTREEAVSAENDGAACDGAPGEMVGCDNSGTVCPGE